MTRRLGTHRLALQRPMHLQLAVRVHIDDDGVAVIEAAVEDGHREWVLDQPLDRPLERASAERRIVALLGEDMLRVGSYENGNLAIGEQLLEPLELEIDDLLDLLLAER